MKKHLLETMGRRIKMAREMRGMTLDALSKVMNPSVTKQAISKYEKGLAIPGSAVLISLSNALNVAVDYFFRQQIISINKIAFHKKAALSVAKAKAINETVRDHVERYFEVSQILDAQYPPLGNLWPMSVSNGDEVKEMVKILKASWGIGNGPIGNVIDILEQHGIVIIEIDADKDFDGLSGWVDDTYPIVVLNKTLEYEVKRFTALHELGHILISAENDEKQMEMLCNLFAGEMLVSDAKITDLMGAKVKEIFLNELENVRDIYGISIDALLAKMQRLGIISKSIYKAFIRKKSDDNIFKSRVEQSSRAKAEFSHRFVNMVCRAMAVEAISESKAASLLNVSMSELRTIFTPLPKA